MCPLFIIKLSIYKTRRLYPMIDYITSALKAERPIVLNFQTRNDYEITFGSNTVY